MGREAVSRTETLSEGTSWANSEVFPSGSVAVPEMDWPSGSGVLGLNEKTAKPPASVWTEITPIRIWPSPKPEGSAVLLAKSWIVNVVFVVQSRVPPIVVEFGPAPADLRAGDACELFGPMSDYMV